MRIGIITGEYPPMQGGVGAYTQVLAREIVRHPHEVLILTTTHAASSDEYVDAIIKHWHVGSLWSIRTWAKNRRIDVLNFQFQTSAFNMSPWIHFLPQVIRHIPVVTTFHDLRFPYLFPKAGSFRTRIVAQLARSSDGVIVTNHEDMYHVEQMAAKQIRFIPIGSNILAEPPPIAEHSMWRKQVDITNDDFIVAHFGFVNRSKGLEDLLIATASLRDQSIPVKLLMIGGRTGASDTTNADYVHEIDTLIEQNDLGDSIRWTGYVDDDEIAACLTASNVVVLPYGDGASFRRGSLMAAIHYGCAIITTTPSVAVPEFQHGKNMILVPASHPEKLTNALVELYLEPEQCNQLRAGAALLAKQFNWHNIAGNYLQFFKTLGVAS